jgi:regulatory protein
MKDGEITRERLERAALAYLNRFDSTAAKLRTMLRGLVRRAERQGPVDVRAAEAMIDELVDRYCASGLIDDRRYAETMASSLRQRGASSRAIRHKLAARGVASDIAGDALAGADRDTEEAELAAARAFVRRRRLGKHRPAEQRAERRQRDLAAVARAGFGFDVAKRALEVELDDDIEDETEA